VTRVFSARVQGGVIVADGRRLPDGTIVTVAANDDEIECTLTPEALAELDAAIAEADADDAEPLSNEYVMAELDRLAGR
jgi:hypothetical protein